LKGLTTCWCLHRKVLEGLTITGQCPILCRLL
jgi:hypothetical protein